MSIEDLIRAAEYLERRERGEIEHGYACPHPPPTSNYTSRRSRVKKSQGNRSSHNELEKNRRAHLKHCLDKLKALVPLAPNSTRHTTLGLLNRAKTFIKNLEQREKLQRQQLDKLRFDYQMLQSQLDMWKPQFSKRRSVSESSSSSSSTGASSSMESEDISSSYSYSNFSDSDDHSSIGSDGDMAVSTKKLTLADF